MTRVFNPTNEVNKLEKLLTQERELHNRQTTLLTIFAFATGLGLAGVAGMMHFDPFWIIVVAVVILAAMGLMAAVFTGVDDY